MNYFKLSLSNFIRGSDHELLSLLTEKYFFNYKTGGSSISGNNFHCLLYSKRLFYKHLVRGLIFKYNYICLSLIFKKMHVLYSH